jgi:hypothetical protein
MTLYRPDVPTVIVRHKELTYQQKAFLLWCWDCRENETRCNLISGRQNCRLRGRTIQWYADFFNIPRQQLSPMFKDLREKGIMQAENIDSRNEIIFINFTVFN